MADGDLEHSFVGARKREQAAYGFEDLVEEIIYSHECGMSKPDPGIYALTCERLSVEPAQMAFLDDSELCVEGARKADMHAVFYQHNSQASGTSGTACPVTAPLCAAWGVLVHYHLVGRNCSGQGKARPGQGPADHPRSGR